MERKERIELRSEEVNQVMGQVPSWIIRWGITILFIVVVSIVTASFFVSYPDAVPAEIMLTHDVSSGKGEDNLKGTILLPAERLGNVKTGQRVVIRLKSYPDQDNGVINGVVSSIEPVSGKDHYRLAIGLPDGLVTTYDKVIPALPVMTGFAEILTDDVRLVERFFAPLRRVLKGKKQIGAY